MISCIAVRKRPLRSRMSFVLLMPLALLQHASNARDGVYQPPRLENGRPSFEGNWDHNDLTPLARLPGFTTLVITAEQAAELERQVTAILEDRATPTEPTEYFNERRILPIRGELHSSIIFDPEDGRIPGTPAFEEWRSKVTWNTLNAMDGPEQRPNSERCLGNPASQPPHLYNPGTNLHQIVQTNDFVVFIAEWMHEARIMRLHSVHAPAAVTSWSGDAIGWWEGDTLVVETRHFTPTDTGRTASGIAIKVSPGTRVTERFTRVSDHELNYVFTVEDPTYYTRPWSGETHFMRTTDQIFEYSCHEGNTTMMWMLEGARERDQR